MAVRSVVRWQLAIVVRNGLGGKRVIDWWTRCSQRLGSSVLNPNSL